MLYYDKVVFQYLVHLVSIYLKQSILHCDYLLYLTNFLKVKVTSKVLTKWLKQIRQCFIWPAYFLWSSKYIFKRLYFLDFNLYQTTLILIKISNLECQTIWEEKIHFLNNSKSMVNSNWDVRNDALDTNDAEDTSDTCLFWINHQPSLSIFNINLLTLLTI